MLKTRLWTRPGAVARQALAVATLCSPLLSGCPTPHRIETDAGVADARRTSPRSLVAESPTNVTLAPGAETLLRVLLRDDLSGAPIEGETLHFGIEGNARGSTLRAVDAVTDMNGVAQVALVAGSSATSFTVRASAADVAALSFSVSVGASFGSLEIEVDARHANAVDSYLARVAMGTSCAGIDATNVIATRTLGVEFPSTNFVNLATDAAWAVEVRGVSTDGTVTAQGCVDDIALRAGETTTISVPVVDRTLEFSPRYSVAVGFDARDATAWVGRFLAPSADDAATSAALLLDALDAELDARLLVEPRARLRAARAAGLDERVAAQLATRDTSFARELGSVVTNVEASLATTTLEGSLVLYPARMEFTGGSLGDAAFSVPLPTTLSALSTTPTGVTIEGATIELRATTLWLNALRLSATRADSPIQRGALCAELGTLASDLTLAACPEDCLAATCTRAIDLAVSALERRTASMEAGLSTISFGVALVGVDTDHDFVADALTTPDFVARWSTVDGTSAVPLTVHWSAASAGPL